MLDALLNYLPQMRKAIVAGLVALVMSWLMLVGVNGNMSVSDALALLGNTLFTAMVTWLVPNKSK